MANYDDIKKSVATTVATNQNNANKIAQEAYTAAKARAAEYTAKSKSDSLKNYRDARRTLGNVSNTTINKLETNYGRAAATANAAGASADAAAQAAYAKSKAATNENANKIRGKNSYEMGKAQAQKSYTDRKRAQDIKDAKSRIKKEQTKQDKQLKYNANQAALDRFKGQVGELETVKACNRLIKKLKKSNDPNKATMLSYVRAHRAKLKEAKKGSGGGGGGWHSWGGGGWRSYGRSYGSTNSSGREELNSSPKKSNDTTAKSAYKKAASKKKSSGGGKKIIPTKLGYNVGGAKAGKIATKRKSNGKIARTRASGRRHWHQ